MSQPHHKNQVSYRAHSTPTHKLTRSERIVYVAKHVAEVAVLLFASFVLYTAVIHFLFY